VESVGAVGLHRDRMQPTVRVAFFGDCTLREMPLSHGVHTGAGYPRLLAERATARGTGFEAGEMFTGGTDELPTSADGLWRHLKLSGAPDLVVVATGHVCAMRTVLPGGLRARMFKQMIGRLVGPAIFLAHALFIRAWIFDLFGRPVFPKKDRPPLDGFVAAVRQTWPGAEIVLVAPFPCLRRGAFDGSLLEQIADEQKAQCARLGVATVDVGDELSRAPRGCANGVNLGLAGHEIVADALEPFVLAAERRVRGEGADASGGPARRTLAKA
jgi:hypothetical protein